MYPPLNIGENESLLRLYIETRDSQIIWRLTCHHLVWIYGLLCKKYSQQYLNDEIFSDAIMAFYRSVLLYKKEFNYYQFRKLAAKLVIGQAGENSYKRKIQLSGKICRNDKLLSLLSSRDQSSIHAIPDTDDFFENIALEDLALFCHKIIHLDKFNNSLTLTQRKTLQVLLNSKDDVEAAKLMGFTRQRVKRIKDTMKLKIKLFVGINSPEMRSILKGQK